MLPLLALLSVALVLPAQDRWLSYSFGPFEVLTNAGEREGRETLNQLVQFRHALGSALGKQELASVWPIRIVAFKSAKQSSPYYSIAGLALARDAFTAAAVAKEPLPRATLRECARILIEANSGRLPGDIESGLADLFSTLEVSGSRITLGQLLPASERNRNWAKMHMLAVQPDYYGKLRVLVHNLGQGVELEPAYRNAFGKPPQEINKEADAYLRTGSFSTAPVNGRTIIQEKEFPGRPVEPSFSEAALADLWLAIPERAADARNNYEAIRKKSPSSAEALEGLGLLALREKRTEEARKLLTASVEAGSTSARAWLEYARLEPDRGKARAALEKAAKLNPRWAAPHFEMARDEPDGAKRLQLLSTAAKLEPRNTEHWETLARAYEEQQKFPEAAKAWACAEQSAAGNAERARIRRTREETERKRAEFEEAEKKRLAEEKQRELEKLKQQAAASIQAALARANADSPPPGPNRKVEQWWEGPRPPAKVQGVLQRVDCLGKQIRIVIEGQDKKLIRFLIRDPKQIVLIGGGERTLGCGPQHPPRKVSVEYFPKPDAKLATAGEAAVLEFP